MAVKTYLNVVNTSGLPVMENDTPKRRQFEEGQQPQLAEGKGLRWLLDEPPSFDADYETRAVSTPIPTEATEVPYTVTDVTLAVAKAKRRKAIDVYHATLIAAGRINGLNTWQIGGKYTANMTMFMAALQWMRAKTAVWGTSTAYVVGDLVRQGAVFYRCAEDHTSGTFVTDLAAGKWAVYFFHPHLNGNGKWRNLANENVSLTTAQAEDMCVDALDYEARLARKAADHKDAVEALSTVTAIKTYDHTANWPTNS